jgi:hypothetical protein
MQMSLNHKILQIKSMFEKHSQKVMMITLLRGPAAFEGFGRGLAGRVESIQPSA